MPSGRISSFIDFIEVENPDEGCTSEAKKMTKVKNLKKNKFFTFSIKILNENVKKLIFQNNY